MIRSGPTYKTTVVRSIRTSRKVKGLCKRFSMADLKSVRVSTLETPTKSQSDKKCYKVIRLENGLTALLISDPKVACASDDDEAGDSSDSASDDDASEDEAGSSDDEREQSGDKLAACAISVGVGSYSDPPDIQGMAHFVEHMLFMGSKKYPSENEFDSFIKRKGGFDNAQTDCEATTFYFEIEENYLNEAMDKFAHFFVSPLMKQEAMQREREAIEAEFALAVPSDTNRTDQLLSELYPAGHPARTFMWGNNRSLTPPLGPTDEVLFSRAHEFRERHYSAHRMTVAVQARFSLETLEQYVVNTFSQVPCNDLPPDDFSKFEFSPAIVTPEFASFYVIKPVMQTINLNLRWCMKSFIKDYRTKPHNYVSWIIGHEGVGSLLYYLKRKVWALTVATGVSDVGNDHTSLQSLFGVSLTLTEKGQKHLNEVLDAVFGYINMMKETCPCERIYKEMRDIEEINFRFKDEPQACDNVERLAECMQFLPPEHYMTGQYLHFEYDPTAIKNIIDSMTPENVNIMLLSQNYSDNNEFDRVEEWFGTEYKKVTIPKENIERWKKIKPEKGFHLPEPNQFIPDNFELIRAPPHILAHKRRLAENKNDTNVTSDLKLELIPPTLLRKDDDMELWFKPDHRFDLPYTYIYLYFISPLPVESAKDVCLLEFWCSMITHLLDDTLYPADVTGLSRDIIPEEKGLMLKVNGFSQKLPAVINEIIEMFKNYNENLTEELFEALKDIKTKFYANIVMKPHKLAKDIRMSIIMNSHWTTLEKLRALKFVTYEDVQKFGDVFTSRLYVKMLMQGNLLEEDSLKIANNIRNTFYWKPLGENDRPKLPLLKLPLGEKLCRTTSVNVANENSCIINYYQYGFSDVKNNCILELIVQIIDEPLFDRLRTKEQLGYKISCESRYSSGVLGLSVTANVQAGKFSAAYVDSRIEKFFKEYHRTMRNMSEESFEQAKTALIKLKNSVDVELKEEIQRHWFEIFSDEYEFDKTQLEIQCLKTLTLEDVNRWYEKYLLRDTGKGFRKLSLQVVGHKQKKCEKKHVDKKPKLNDEVIIMLNDCNYELKYIEEEEIEHNCIKDVYTFKKSLEKYPEKKGVLPSQTGS